jgi:gamma-tubulin complex component 3
VRWFGDAKTGDSGWDVFALEYVVQAPINAVISVQHLEMYNQLFTFLWRLRRVEYTLSNTWCRHMTASHRLSVRLRET